jgi:dihydrofolate reductase/thymidylate synthase
MDSKYGIGLNNELPWGITDELKIFKEKTQNSILIAGRKTAQSLPILHNRLLFVVSRNQSPSNIREFFILFNSVDEAIQEALKMKKNVFVIGGAEIYNYVFEKYKSILNIHVSILKDSYECDTFLREDILKNFYITKKFDHEKFTHYEMVYKEHGEQQYLNLIKDIVGNADLRDTRNSKTLSVFCKHLKFDLRDGFPLLTSKKMFFKGIIEELLFFIRGHTDSSILEEKGINIWKGNTSREFLDNNGFKHRKEGEMGPMYGYQWRYFNARYDPITSQPSEKGVDQLKEVIDLIKINPSSRRILLTTYNPSQVYEGVLYPCHSITIQFYVQDGYLDMFCYNRSSDIGLGLPFNIASSSLLQMIIAQLTELKPRYFNLTLGDAHIYQNHIEPLKEQIERLCYTFPKLVMPEFKTLMDVERLNFRDFKIEDYRCHEPVKMDMVA